MTNQERPSNLENSKKNKGWLTKVLSLLQYPAIFLVIYLAVNWYRMPEMPENISLQVIDYQGQPVDLQAMSEQSPVLVYFWGSWCGVCSITSPKVNSLANTDGNVSSDISRYQVVSIAVKSGNNAELTKYMQKNSYDFTTINDDEGTIFREWEGHVTPSFVILNDGKVTQGMTGIQPLWSLRLRMWVSSL